MVEMNVASSLPCSAAKLPWWLLLPRRQHWTVQYGFALVMVALAFGLRSLLVPALGDRHAFTTFYLAVTMAAWFGGLGPALLASLLGWVIADWWFTPPRFAFGIETMPDLVAVVTFLFVSVAVACFSGAMHMAQQRAEAAARALASYNGALESLVRQRTTELQESYERLRASDRMAMAGLISAGLGHDFGNLLQVCRSSLDAMGRREQTRENRNDIRAIADVMAYVEKLVCSLRRLTHDPAQTYSPASTNLAVWWIETEPLLRTALPPGVRISGELPDDAPDVNVDVSSLSQIIFNLVHNAGTALRGQLYGQVRVWATWDAAADVVAIGVSDNGPGMTADIRSRCMELFFTTSPRSSGLGLALVHHLVRKVSGSLAIESEVGRGATFIIRLPVAGASLKVDTTSTIPRC